MTYTLVTVLALLALEILVLLLIVLLFSATHLDRSEYLSDVIFTQFPRAARYMQPDALNPAGLQAWLAQVYASRHASSDPINVTG